MTPVANRLVRLLNMVPYFQANPRVSYRKAAADLGVSVKQLRQDLDQLWLCGLPGYLPGDLIDFEFSGDTIAVTFSAGMDRPLRLTSTEASGLLIALRALAEIPGVVDPAAALSAIAKIEAAAGTASEGPTAVKQAVAEPAPIEQQAATAVRAALRDRRALRIDYYSASHDTLTSRTVDPIQVQLIGDHSYLEAWCRQAEGVRLFRFDRIVEATELEEPAVPPPGVDGRLTALFDADPSLPTATLRVAPAAAWMLEYFPMRITAELPGGYCEAAMTYATQEWMARLILGFGADVTVLAPESLAETVRRSACEALAAYGNADG